MSPILTDSKLQTSSWAFRQSVEAEPSRSVLFCEKLQVWYVMEVLTIGREVNIAKA